MNIRAPNKARDVTVLTGDWQDEDGNGMMPDLAVIQAPRHRANH
jgi:hypothetical protein